MAENPSDEKDIGALENFSRVPAKAPLKLKPDGQSLCGRVPQETEMLALEAGRVPQKSPLASRGQPSIQNQVEAKVTNQSSHKVTTTQKGGETPPVKKPE